MDTKNKKKLVAAKSRLENLQKCLAGSKAQPDDPNETIELEKQVQETKKLILSLKD